MTKLSMLQIDHTTTNIKKLKKHWAKDFDLVIAQSQGA